MTPKPSSFLLRSRFAGFTPMVGQAPQHLGYSVQNRGSVCQRRLPARPSGLNSCRWMRFGHPTGPSSTQWDPQSTQWDPQSTQRSRAVGRLHFQTGFWNWKHFAPNAAIPKLLTPRAG